MPRRVSKLQKLRLSRTMSQALLAEAVGISQQQLSKYESGELIPPADIRAKLATVLGTSSELIWASLALSPSLTTTC